MELDYVLQMNIQLLSMIKQDNSNKTESKQIVLNS